MRRGGQEPGKRKPRTGVHPDAQTSCLLCNCSASSSFESTCICSSSHVRVASRSSRRCFVRMAPTLWLRAETAASIFSTSVDMLFTCRNMSNLRSSPSSKNVINASRSIPEAACTSLDQAPNPTT